MFVDKVKEVKEEFTKFVFDHGKKVAKLISHLEDLIEYCGGDVKRLKYAAIYHDIGKSFYGLKIFLRNLNFYPLPGEKTSSFRERMKARFEIF